MDRVKKYVLQMFDDYNKSSYLFDYDVTINDDVENVFENIKNMLKEMGYTIKVHRGETEKKKYPVWRLDISVNDAEYHIYVLKISDNSTRVFAVRKDPLWVYIVTPLLFFFIALSLLYLLIFSKVPYYIQGILFLASGMLLFGYVYFVEKRLSYDVADFFRQISEYAEKSKIIQ